MKIIVFYQYFSTNNGFWGTRYYELAKVWVKNNHKVTIITSIYSKSDLRTKKNIETLEIDGIKIKVIKIFINNKNTFFRRLINFLLYAIISIKYAIFLKADIMIFSSGPLTIGIPMFFAKIFNKVKIVFEVRDILPKVAIDLGVLKNKIIIKLSLWTEKMLYKKSDLIVCLSQDIKKHVVKIENKSKTIIITNFANISFFSIKTVRPKEMLKKKYAIYVGNIGKVNDIYLLLRTAKYLNSIGRNDIKIILLGDGQEKKNILKVIKKENINNLIIIKSLKKTETVPYLQHAVVSLVTLKSISVLDASSPNKFFESLAAGTPVIQTTNGWIKNYININKLGFNLKNNNEKALSNLLINIMDNNIEIKKMQERIKKTAEKDFCHIKIAEKYQSALAKLM